MFVCLLVSHIDLSEWLVLIVIWPNYAAESCRSDIIVQSVYEFALGKSGSISIEHLSVQLYRNHNNFNDDILFRRAHIFETMASIGRRWKNSGRLSDWSSNWNLTFSVWCYTARFMKMGLPNGSCLIAHHQLVKQKMEFSNAIKRKVKLVRERLVESPSELVEECENQTRPDLCCYVLC